MVPMVSLLTKSGITRRTGSADLSDTCLLKEGDHFPAAALRLILEEEMANTLEQHKLRAGNLLRETRRVVEWEVLVLLGPQDQRGDLESGEPALVRLELVEVEGAIELEHAAAVSHGGERLPVLV